MSAVLAEAIAAAAARQARGEPGGCFHCGRPLLPDAGWHATIDGRARAMCCAGCAAAAQAIVDAGCAAYYATRAGFAPTATCAAPEQAPEHERTPASTAPAAGEGEFNIDGVRCAAGAWLVERRLGQLNGVREARLDLARARLAVRWDPAACDADAVQRCLHGIGVGCWPGTGAQRGEHVKRARRTLLRRLGVAGVSTLQVAMVALPAWLARVADDDANGGAERGTDGAVGWAGLLFTLPSLLYSARPFFGGAWRGLRRRAPGIDLPLALAIGAAFIGSCAALLSGAGEVYFGSLALFIFLLLGSRYLELAARIDAARALERLQQGLPHTALRLRGDPLARDTEVVPAAALQAGDLVLVQAGQAAPADGIIHEGDTVLDLSLLSGESRTRVRGPGDTLPGGALNVGQAIVLRVIACAGDSTLALLVRLAERAAQGKPALARRAERAAGCFMGALVALAVLVFCAWLPLDAARAWQAALAVLMAACPCALSLATPSALAAAGERLLRRGVLALQPHTLETFDRATHVVFDKTGTLTYGRPVLRQALPVGALGVDACLRIAAALEADNPHPLAQPIRAAAQAAAARHEEDAEHDEETEPLSAERLHFVVGQGVEGWVDERCYRLGSAAWVAGVAGGVARAAVPAGTTSVWLGNGDGWLARFDLCDELRPDAAEVVRRLRAAGKSVLLLSGDDHGATQAVAAQLGIPGALGGKLPEEKLNHVRRLQRGGAVVAMVGDGINDAAVLRGADVSFAMGGKTGVAGQGAELAQLYADAVLLGGGLQPLAEALDTARRTLAVIRQNLAWVTVYNLAAIPAAAVGLLQPWMAGIGMAAGAALVVLNAMRLRRD